MNGELYYKYYDCYKKANKIYSKDIINLVEYNLINKDYLNEGSSFLSNIYKIMTILYGNQVSKEIKEEYLKLLANNIISLTDYQEQRFDEIFRPNGKILNLKNSLENEALDYVNHRGTGDIQEVGRNVLSEINNSSNNDLRCLIGSWSGFKPFVDGYYYEVCKRVGTNAVTYLDVDFDYNLTLNATNIGGNLTTKDVIEDLYCYVEGTKYNPTAYLFVDSIVDKAMNECLISINKLDKYGKLVKIKENN